MAKGQLRGNKEAKKPKQQKKPAPPAGGFQAPSKSDKSDKRQVLILQSARPTGMADTAGFP